LENEFFCFVIKNNTSSVILVMEKVKKFKKNVKKGDEWSVLGDKWNEIGWLFRRKELFLQPKVTKYGF
jgi:hypothetical protein